MPIKFKFSEYTASVFEPYVTLFQTDVPLIPFMYEQLKEIYDKLLSMVFKIDSLEQVSISKKLKASWLNKKKQHLENGLVNVGAATKLKLKAAKVLLEKKRKFRGVCKAVILNILIKFAEKCPLVYRLIGLQIGLQINCSIWFATMENHLNFSKRLLIIFLPCIKPKQVLQTSQNHKWISFWRWLDLIRRRSLRTFISTKIVWMYFLDITSQSGMRLYVHFCRKGLLSQQRGDWAQHEREINNLIVHCLWWYSTTFKQQGFRFSYFGWNEKELQSLAPKAQGRPWKKQERSCWIWSYSQGEG